MAVRSKDEILALIKERIGDDTSDDAIKIMEDVTDTLTDYETRIADSGDWQARYEQNDAEWRKKYIERFTTGGEPQPEPADEPEEYEETEIKTFDELFKEED